MEIEQFFWDQQDAATGLPNVKVKMSFFRFILSLHYVVAFTEFSKSPTPGRRQWFVALCCRLQLSSVGKNTGPSKSTPVT